MDATDCKTNGVETGMDIDEFCPWVVHMTMEEIEAMPSPCFFNTHMPYNLMPGGDPVNSPAKYIYIIRNPKDVHGNISILLSSY